MFYSSIKLSIWYVKETKLRTCMQGFVIIGMKTATFVKDSAVCAILMAITTKHERAPNAQTRQKPTICFRTVNGEVALIR